MPGSFLSPFSEADLHGLVDGGLDSGRQADLLRRLKSNPVDKERVEGWREQNDLIRATFSEVEHEPLPVSLNLAPPPRLRCVASDGCATVSRPPPPPMGFMGRVRSYGSGFFFFGGLTGVVVIAGIAWGLNHRGMATATVAVVASASFDDALAARTLDALTNPPTPTSARNERDLPTTSIPDLDEAGFAFRNATLEPGEPSTLIFLYENDAAERVAIGVAKRDHPADSKDAMGPVQAGRAIAWHRRDQVFAVAGTVEARRLGAIAVDVQANQQVSDQQ